MCGRHSSAKNSVLSILLMDLIGGFHDVPAIQCSEDSRVWHRVSQVEIGSSGNTAVLGAIC